MKKFLKIRDSNRFIYFKNRKVRTPTIIEVTDNDLKTINTILKMADVQDFEVIVEEDFKEEDKLVIPSKEDGEIVIEELEILGEVKEPSTLLEGFMRNGEE